MVGKALVSYKRGSLTSCYGPNRASGMTGMGRLAASRANDDDNGVFIIVSDAKAFAASSSNPDPFIRNARVN